MAEATLLERRLSNIAEVRCEGLLLRHAPFETVVKFQVPGAATEALVASIGTVLPERLRRVEFGGMALNWIAPAEFLLVGSHAKTWPLIERISAALAAHHAMTTDLTDASAVFRLSGDDARRALAAHCPLDLSGKEFPVGSVARSLFGDTVILVSLDAVQDGTPSFTLIGDQTKAPYLTRQFCNFGCDGPRTLQR